MQSTTQNLIPPSAKRRVERSVAGYEEFIKNDSKDSYRHDPAGDAPPELPIYHSEFLRAASACLKMLPDFLVAAKADKNPQLTTVLKPEIIRMLETFKSMPESVAVVGRIGQGNRN